MINSYNSFNTANYYGYQANNRKSPMPFKSNSSLELTPREKYIYFDHFKENKKYFDILETFVPDSGYKPTPGKDQNIVMLGSSMGTESTGIISYFGGKEFGELSDDVNVFGIDIDKLGTSLGQEYFKPIKQIKIINDNNLNLPNIKEIPKKLDVVTFRNPEIKSKYVDDFTQMIKQSYDQLREGGIIVATFILDRDKANFEESLRQLKLKPIVDSPTRSRTDDNHIFIIRKD